MNTNLDNISVLNGDSDLDNSWSIKSFRFDSTCVKSVECYCRLDTFNRFLLVCLWFRWFYFFVRVKTNYRYDSYFHYRFVRICYVNNEISLFILVLHLTCYFISFSRNNLIKKKKNKLIDINLDLKINNQILFSNWYSILLL